MNTSDQQKTEIINRFQSADLTSVVETKTETKTYLCECCRYIIDGTPDHILTINKDGDSIPFCDHCYTEFPRSGLPQIRCCKCEKSEAMYYLLPVDNGRTLDATRYKNWICRSCCDLKFQISYKWNHKTDK